MPYLVKLPFFIHPLKSLVSIVMMGALGVSLLACQKTPNRSEYIQHKQSQSEPSQVKPIATTHNKQDVTPPDLNQSSVITTSTIAIKNTARHSDTTHLPYANPHAPKGGRLSQAVSGSFNSLNPFIDQGVAAAGWHHLYDTLMTASLDESYVLYPQLATSITYDTADPSWVIYHIHPDARFWDGSPVTAHDVVASFEAIMRDGLISWRGFLAGLEKVQALDDARVIFYFNDTASPTLYADVGLMPIFAKIDIERYFKQVSLRPLMGSGAYQVAHIDAGRAISYVRDTNYWGARVMANEGRFNFERIDYHYFADDNVARQAFISGLCNYRAESDIKAWATFDVNKYHIPIIKHAITHTNPVSYQGLVMNMRRPLFKDKRVRVALLYAFDWAGINARFYHGQYERLTSYFYGASIAATGAPSADELAILQSLPLNTDEISAPFSVMEGVPQLPAQVARDELLIARQLLLSAHFYYKNGYLYTPDGQRAAFEILIENDTHKPALLSYIKNLARLGFSVRIRQMDSNGYRHKKRMHDYDMIIDTFMQSNTPAGEQRYLWGSDAAVQTGSANSIGIRSAAVDVAIEQLINAQTYEQVLRQAHVLDRLLLAGVYVIPFGGRATTDVLYHDTITPPDRLPTAAVGLDYWYTKPKNKSNFSHLPKIHPL